jgi:hypothetical protein
MRGALVVDELLEGADGRLLRLGREAMITVSARITYAPQRRFVIAHEIGHLEMHGNGGQFESCSEAQISHCVDNDAEREASAFASELLMPSGQWKPETDVSEPNLDVISKLAKDYEVSLAAAAIRFTELSPHRLCVVMSTKGRVQWSWEGPRFGYRVERGAKLVSATIASDWFKHRRVVPDSAMVPANSWLDACLDRADTIVEHCRQLPALDSTLSLLWIPPGQHF